MRYGSSTRIIIPLDCGRFLGGAGCVPFLKQINIISIAYPLDCFARGERSHRIIFFYKWVCNMTTEISQDLSGRQAPARRQKLNATRRRSETKDFPQNLIFIFFPHDRWSYEQIYYAQWYIVCDVYNSRFNCLRAALYIQSSNLGERIAGGQSSIKIFYFLKITRYSFLRNILHYICHFYFENLCWITFTYTPRGRSTSIKCHNYI